MDIDADPVSEQIGNLKDVVQRAVAEHPTRCNRSTAAVARAFGITALDSKLANAQIGYMEQH